MPNPKDPRWRERVFRLHYEALERGERLSAKKIENKLAQLGEPDYPLERTIRDWLKAHPAGEQSAYQVLRWPETFEAGLLPWEASETVLDLLRRWPVGGEPDRPTVDEARWYYRLKLAVPDAPPGDLVRAAIDLARGLHMDQNGIFREPERAIEDWLRFRPWLDGDARHAYLEAVESGQVAPWSGSDLAPERRITMSAAEFSDRTGRQTRGQRRRAARKTSE